MSLLCEIGVMATIALVALWLLGPVGMVAVVVGCLIVDLVVRTEGWS